MVGMTLNKDYFAGLTPFILLLNLGLILFHEKNLDNNKSKFFLFIFASGFALELIGVSTGKIFGSYYYGNALGFSLKYVPVIIGVNWLVVSWTASGIIERLNLKNDLLFALLSSLLMVALDALIEPIAAKLDFWYFINNLAPLRNYIAWFIISFFFQLLYRNMPIKVENKISSFIYLIQVIFFIFLNFIFLNTK